MCRRSSSPASRGVRRRQPQEVSFIFHALVSKHGASSYRPFCIAQKHTTVSAKINEYHTSYTAVLQTDQSYPSSVGIQEHEEDPARVSSGEEEEEDASGSEDLESDATFSPGELDLIASLDKVVIIDNLPAVSQDAESILSEALRNTRSISPKRLHSFYQILLDSLAPYGGKLYLKPYLIARALFDGAAVNPGFSERWRPDCILHKANISLLLSRVVLSSYDFDVDSLATLSYLTTSDVFPSPFIGTEIGKRLDAKGADDTFDLGLSIFTQCFLAAALRDQKKEDFEPETLLSEVFDEAGASLTTSIYAEDKNKYHLESVRRIESRKRLVRSFYMGRDEASKPIEIERLRARFPWQVFTDQVVSWCVDRCTELDRLVGSQGGVEAIARRIRDAEFSSGSQTRTEAMFPITTAGAKQAFWPAELESAKEVGTAVRKFNRLKEIKARRALGQSSRVPMSTPGYTVAENQIVPEEEGPRDDEEIPESLNPGQDGPEDGGLPDPEDMIDIQGLRPDNDTLSVQWEGSRPAVHRPSPALTQEQHEGTKSVMAVLNRAVEQSHKENDPPINRAPPRFLDRQTNAYRENFEDQGRPVMRGSSTRRQHPASDHSEDDFETDDRAPKKTRLVASTTRRSEAREISEERGPDDNSNKSPSPSESLPSLSDPRTFASTARREIVNSESDSRPAARDAPAPRAPLRRERPPPPSFSATEPPTRGAAPQPSSVPQRTAPPPRLPLAPHQEAQLQAKENVLRRRQIAPIPQEFVPQVRRPWGVDETERLIKLIQHTGCAWAQILVEDRKAPVPLLQNRTQVQLKDKARNIKMDYLKAFRPLPNHNFLNVTISASHKKLLLDMGYTDVGADFAVEVDNDDDDDED